MENYAHLNFNEQQLSQAMRDGYKRLIDFVNTPQFRELHDEMRALPATERPKFVARTFMSMEELERRGIQVPKDILIQRSSFGDRRPTLFAVKMFLPEKFQSAWENVNITFDNDFEDESVSREAEQAWRPPMPVELQDELISEGVDLNSVDVSLLKPKVMALGIERSPGC